MAKVEEKVVKTTCDRCGGGPCVKVGADLLTLWHSASYHASPPEDRVEAPDLCKPCIARLSNLARQICTQRRRAWSEKAV